MRRHPHQRFEARGSYARQDESNINRLRGNFEMGPKKKTALVTETGTLKRGRDRNWKYTNNSAGKRRERKKLTVVG